MAKERLYRVCEKDSETNSWQLYPIEKTENGYAPKTESKSITVRSTSDDEQIAQVASFVETGHVIAAAIDSSATPATLESIEHRGGFTLEYLDPRVSIDFVDALWESIEETQQSSIDSEIHGGGRVLSSLEDPLSDEEPVGEVMVMETMEEPSDTWSDFTAGPLGEQIYGSFNQLEGMPEEVLAGNPSHTDYWYVLLFESERTALAWEIRSKFGIPYSGTEYHSNPDIDINIAINDEAVPQNPNNEPLALLEEQYHHAYDTHPIPEHAGKDTIELIAEFLVMGAELDLLTVLDYEDLQTISSDELLEQDLPLLTAFIGHVELLLSTHKTIVDQPGASTNELIESSAIPDPEKLQIMRRKLDERAQLHRAYVDKMNAVTLEDYVFSPLKYLPQSSIDDISRKAGKTVAPIHEEIHDALRIHEALVGRIESYLEMSDRMLRVKDESGELTYELVGEEGSYAEIAETRDTVRSAVMKNNHYRTVASRIHSRFTFADAFSMHGQFGEIMDLSNRAGHSA